MSSLVNNKIFLEPFFIELNTQQIQYCVLRNYETLPVSLGGSDLDILVQNKDINKLYKALHSVLQRTKGEIIIRYGQLSPRICVTGFNTNCWYALQIDVHESILPYKSSSMFPVNLLLSRVHTHNDIKVANDDDSNLIAFLKEVLNNKQISLKYFKPAKTAWSKNKGLYKQELSKVYSVDFLEDLSETLQSNYSAKAITKLAKRGQKQLTKNFKTKVLNLKLKLFKVYRFFSPPGYTIAFLGTDSARKAIVINKVIEVLNEASHNQLYYERSRPNLIPSIAKLLSNKKVDGLVVTSPQKKERSNFIVSMMRFLYYLVDYIVGYWLKVYPKKVITSCIWVFDSYFYSYLVGSKRERIKLPAWIIKLAQVFIPEPDLVICLGESPEIICNNRPETTLKETESQVNSLKLFCDSKSNAFWIDIGQAEEVPINECLRIISENMSSRYK